MEFSKEDTLLIAYVLQLLDIYVSDDDNYEMVEEMKKHGFPDFNSSVVELYEKILKSGVVNGGV